MRYAAVQGEIVDEISNRQEGISFNGLANRLHGRASRVRLLNEVNSLQREGLILVKADPKHKQKKVFRLGLRLEDVVNKMRFVEDKTFGNPMDGFSNLLSTHVRSMSSAQEYWYEEFMRHPLQKYVRRMLIKLEGGMADG